MSDKSRLYDTFANDEPPKHLLSSKNGDYLPPSVKSDPKFQPFRPRLIFCPLFAWNAVTGGKFIAPFLKKISPAFSDSMVGLTLAIQYAIVACLAGWGGRLSDLEEKQSPRWGWGRLKVLSWGILLGTLAFLGHDVVRYVNDSGYSSRNKDIQSENHSRFFYGWDVEILWHVAMRSLWAMSFALTAPALDGLTLAHLNRIEGESLDFGRERMYGAICWGLGSLASGIGLDYYGFKFLYFLAVVTAFMTFMSIGVYLWGVGKDATGTFSVFNSSLDDARTYNDSVVRGRPSRNSPEQNVLLRKTTCDDISTKALFMLFCQTYYGSALIFFVFTFAIGMAVIDNLAFIFFDFLGSSNTIDGWTVMFTVVFELPLFYMAPDLLKRHGPGRLLLFSGAAYVVRVVGYILVPVGHMGIVLLLETLHGICYACSKTGSVEFFAQIMPKGYEASGQGILFVIRFLGVVVGLAVGGWAQDSFGPRTMYGGMAGTVLLGLCVLLFAELQHHTEILSRDDDDFIEQHENDRIVNHESPSPFATESTEKWVRSLKYDSLTKHKSRE